MLLIFCAKKVKKILQKIKKKFKQKIIYKILHNFYGITATSTKPSSNLWAAVEEESEKGNFLIASTTAIIIHVRTQADEINSPQKKGMNSYLFE